MQKTSGSFGETPTWNAAQLSRVTRLIRLITEFKTNPRQTPEKIWGRWGSAEASILGQDAAGKGLWF